MENLILLYPKLMLLTWILLNLLHRGINFLNLRLYKNLMVLDSSYITTYNRKYFLKFLLWLGFGIGMLAALRQQILNKNITGFEYFTWVGAFFFIVIGYFLNEILLLTRYFVYQKDNSTLICPSHKTALILTAIEFFGYSVLVLLGFFITKTPFLLGGTIGLAFGGFLYIFQLITFQNDKQPKIR